MRSFLILFLSILFWGCSSTYVSDRQTVSIAQDVDFQLITGHPFTNDFHLLQSAQVNYNNELHDLLFQTEVSEKQLVMVGLSATGTRLFSIQLTAGQITASGLPTDDGLKPEYLLADMQLSLWPASSINHALSGAELVQPDATQRLIMRDQKEIIRIEYSHPEFYKGRIHFQHLERGYSLLIEPLSIEETLHEPE